MSDLVGPAYVAARWGFYLAVFLTIGASSFAPFFFPRGNPFRVAFPEAARTLHRRAATTGLVASIAVLAFAVFRFWMQTRTLRDPGDPLTSEFVRAVLSTSWGRGWQRQAALTIPAALGFGLARTRTTGWILATLSAVGLAVTTGMTGHAATAEAGPGGGCWTRSTWEPVAFGWVGWRFS